MDPVRHLKVSLLVLSLLVTIGTVGYMTIEGWRLLDALYMTVITLGTVGFKEVADLSDAGKIFTIFLIIIGVSVLGYIVGSLAQIMFEGQFQRIIGRKKVENRIKSLKNHYIICGYGRIGSLICKEFAANPLPFVVVEKSPEIVERLSDLYLVIQGDATADETLLHAGIREAKGLITAVTSDTENVYITLTARGLNPDLYILARSGEEGSELKLQRAGANKVISPYTIGGNRMAQAILRPNVVDFIEIATGRGHLELQMEEIQIPGHSAFIGENLITSGFRRETGVIIVGIKKKNGRMVFNPEPKSTLEEKDTLIVLGQPTAVLKLEELINHTTHAERKGRKEHHA